MEVSLVKTNNFLCPADPEAEEWAGKLKQGEYLIADIKRPRNPQFHKKFMSLLRAGFSYWEPGEISGKYGKPEKNFDRYRKDLIILAGYWKESIRLDGSVRIEAKSIRFGRMEQDEFEKLYSNVHKVLMERVFTGWESKDVGNIVNHLMSYI